MPTSTAANINKLALAQVHKALPQECQLLPTVHDSVLIEVPDDQTGAVGRMVTRVLETETVGFSVPLVVDVKCGRDWNRCK